MSGAPVSVTVNESIAAGGTASEKWKEHSKSEPQYSDLSDHSEHKQTNDELNAAAGKDASEGANGDAVEKSNNNDATEEDEDDKFESVGPRRTLSNISAISLETGSLDGLSVGGGASVDGSRYGGAGSVDGSRVSRAESIRARLRQQERRLSEMVHRQASVEGVVEDKFKQEMDEVKSNLDKVEQEKYALEQKLEFLSNQKMQEQAVEANTDLNDHDAFLRDKLNGIQKGFQEQASKIQALENDLVSKNVEIDKYRYEIVSKLKRIVELEFDLQMHDIHFTDYSDRQFKLGPEALALLKKDQATNDPEVEQHSWDHMDSPDKAENIDAVEAALKPGKHGGEDSESEVEEIEIEGVIYGKEKKLTPARGQKLIAKLLRDLDHLEATYKKEKLKTVRTKEQLKNENDELKTKIHVLEQEQKHQQHLNKHGRSGMNDISGYMNIYQLRKRVETLEAKRFLYRKEMARLEDEMKQFQKEAEMKAEKHKAEVTRLQLELDAANARARTLAEGYDGEIDKERENHYSAIEKRIVKNYEVIARLESNVEIKDRQITTLRKEIEQLRLQEIANGKTDSKLDAEILKGEKDLEERMNRGDDESEHSVPENDENSPKANVSAAFVADLQKQLLLAHEQLVKKDQELVIERAKSACMAANLLDRIAELEKEGEKKKKRESMKHGHPEGTRSGGRRPTPGDKQESAPKQATEESNRSLDVEKSPEKKKDKKPRKTMSSRIPFRFSVKGGKKEGGKEEQE